MKTIFADSFFYFALLNPDDPAHEQAEGLLEDFDGKLVTTAWVLTEVADGMADPADRSTFVHLHEVLSRDPDVTIVPPDAALFADGLALYAQRADKEWSLTDCVSFIVMQRHGLTEALTGDHHFEQAGFKALLQ
ncbi:MAG TPA: PIN domain-containing protein [Verrucomicrobiae bacterium]|nr:PIN domain-containing protein [Verrucomicrobiae bacterium]